MLLLAYFLLAPLGVPVSAVTGIGALMLLVLAGRWHRGGRSAVIPVRKVLRDAPWQIVVFSLGMYLVVYGLRNAGLTDYFGRALTGLAEHGSWVATIGTGFGAAILSSVMNNMPSVLVGALAVEHAQGIPPVIRELMIYANVVGCDLGPKFTPIGSLATLLWLHVLARKGEAKAFYDWFGARQDSQRFYEDAAVDDLVAHGDFERAHSVLEFGCGTGRFANRLLSGHLPADSHYRALDISTTMVRLARQRLARWGERVSVEQTLGGMAITVQDASADCFVTCYVLDLLAESDIRELLDEAGRVVAPDGLLCCVCSTRGTRLSAKIVSGVWEALFRLNPKLVGGCRPIGVRDFLDSARWSVRYANIVMRFGISSEIVVAIRAPEMSKPA